MKKMLRVFVITVFAFNAMLECHPKKDYSKLSQADLIKVLEKRDKDLETHKKDLETQKKLNDVQQAEILRLLPLEQNENPDIKAYIRSERMRKAIMEEKVNFSMYTEQDFY